MRRVTACEDMRRHAMPLMIVIDSLRLNMPFAQLFALVSLASCAFPLREPAPATSFVTCTYLQLPVCAPPAGICTCTCTCSFPRPKRQVLLFEL